METVLTHMALAGDPRSHNFRQAVDVDRLDAEAGFKVAAHRLAPRLGAESPTRKRHFAISMPMLGATSAMLRA